MIFNNILFNYSRIAGIEDVLKGLAGRAKFNSRMGEAVTALEKDYTLYESDFTVFFPELIEHAGRFMDGKVTEPGTYSKSL